ncbi:MAG: four-carbon acid sugar kinase family protein, partial [Planctomycetota bacterium]
MFFGAIADDYTGATDLAGTLVNAGLRVVQTFGPGGAVDPESVDAVVVALKSRSNPAGDAVGQSLEALEYLKRLGADRYFFKYCSTFDSTPDGNIGPVAAALADAVGNEKTLFVPSFPENGRTVCHGHLFVDGVLLNESGMERHPLNPMTDANLVRVLAAQSDRAVGLVPRTAFGGGCGDVRRVIDEAAEPFLVVDALDNRDLIIIAEAVPDLALATGGSAFAGYLA